MATQTDITHNMLRINFDKAIDVQTGEEFELKSLTRRDRHSGRDRRSERRSDSASNDALGTFLVVALLAAVIYALAATNRTEPQNTPVPNSLPPSSVNFRR